MTEKRSLREVIAEAQAEMRQWPAGMKELNDFRREEMRKIDQAQAPDSDRSAVER